MVDDNMLVHGTSKRLTTKAQKDSPASNRRRRCLSGSSERPDTCQRSPLRKKDESKHVYDMILLLYQYRNRRYAFDIRLRVRRTINFSFSITVNIQITRYKFRTFRIAGQTRSRYHVLVSKWAVSMSIRCTVESIYRNFRHDIQDL